MPRKKTDSSPQENPVSAVDFVTAFNADVEGFEIDLSLQVEQRPEGNVVYAGISVQMGHADMPAFIPSDVLRQLADEADAMAQKAIDDANSRRR